MTRGALSFLFVVGLVCSLAGAAVADQRIKLAVSEVQARRGVDSTLARVIEEYLVTEIAKTGQYSVIGRDDILRLLHQEEERIKVTGCADDECLAEIGGALGVDFLVGGSLDRVGESVLVNLKVLNVRRAQVVARDGERLKGASEEDLLDGVSLLFRRLFGPGGPMEQLLPRGPGAGEQSAAGPGQETATGGGSSGETATGGESAVVPVPEPGSEAELSAAVEPERGRVWTWVAGGLGLALGGAGVGLLVVAGQRDSEAHDLARDARAPGTVTYAAIKDAEDEATLFQTAGLVCASVGAAAVIAGVVLFFLEGPDEAPAATAAPWLHGNGAGLTAAVRF